MKTAEEVLDEHLMPAWRAGIDEDAIIEAMQEYAFLYHKEKLREELAFFTIYISKIDYKDADAERVIDEYLKSLDK